MATFLANENIPLEAILAIRSAGHDVAWVSDIMPGADDVRVLAQSLSDRRVLVTFDKDFGELAFRAGLDFSCGVILLRPKLTSRGYIARFIVGVLAQSLPWEGHFSVAEEGHVRMVPLPN